MVGFVLCNNVHAINTTFKRANTQKILKTITNIFLVKHNNIFLFNLLATSFGH